MRLPVVHQISTKDGTSNKNSRLTNCLRETTKTADKAVIRPGLALSASASGVGRGVVRFNNQLVSVYGTTLGAGIVETGASGVLSEITGTIDADQLTECARSIGGTEWLFGGINNTTEEGELYVYDSSDDSTTLLSTGMPLCDITGIAYNGANVVVTSRAETFAGSPGLFVADAATLTFSEVTGMTYLDPFAVKYASGKFVVISTGLAQSGIAWSSNSGSTWAEATIPSGKGRDLLFDGTAWWFFCGDGSSNISAYRTTDFAAFALQSLSGLPASTAVVCCAYKSGTYYLIANDLYTSADGLNWTATGTGLSAVVDGSDGNVYGAKASTDTLYLIEGADVSSITATAFTGSYRKMDSNGSGSIVVSPAYSNRVIRVDVTAGSASIPALATITGDNYDFAQSTT